MTRIKGEDQRPSIQEEIQIVTQTWLTLSRAEKKKERRRLEASRAKIGAVGKSNVERRQERQERRGSQIDR